VKYLFLTAALSMLMVLAGCEDKKPEGASAPTSGSAAAAAAEAAPTEEDFEDEAEKAITASADINSELDKLEKEIEN